MPDWLQIALFILGWLLAGVVVARVGLKVFTGGVDAEDAAPIILLCLMIWPLLVAVAPLLAVVYGAIWLVARPSWNPWKREDSK